MLIIKEILVSSYLSKENYKENKKEKYQFQDHEKLDKVHCGNCLFSIVNTIRVL